MRVRTPYQAADETMDDTAIAGIVVPCFNEADRLDRWQFLKFAQLHSWVRFYFVNDGSRDLTGEVLRKMAAQMPGRMVRIDLAQNSGKAEAVRQGVLAAYAENCHMIGYFDADLATPLRELARMRDVLLRRDDIELVLGSRLPLAGRCIQRRPVRSALGRLFALLARVLLGLPVSDTQCGAKLFRATPTIHASFQQPFRTRWIFDVELLCRCVGFAGHHWLQTHLYELPLEQWRDVAGSKVRGRDFVTAGRELLRIAWSYRWRPPARQETMGEPPLREDHSKRRVA